MKQAHNPRHPEPTGWDVLLGYDPHVAAPASMAALAAQVSEATGVAVEDLKRHDRSKAISQPRQAFMSLAVDAGKTLGEIGRFLGGRDHTTIMHGARIHKRRLAEGKVDRFGRVR